MKSVIKTAVFAAILISGALSARADSFNVQQNPALTETELLTDARRSACPWIVSQPTLTKDGKANYTAICGSKVRMSIMDRVKALRSLELGLLELSRATTDASIAMQINTAYEGLDTILDAVIDGSSEATNFYPNSNE